MKNENGTPRAGGFSHVPHQLTDSRLANVGAQTILEAFDSYQNQFKAITKRAQDRFENRDWHGMRADTIERLDLRRQVIDQMVCRIGDLLGDRLRDRLVWAGMKAVFSGRIVEREDWELAETFFNSVTRHIFDTVGVDPRIEFVDTDFETPPNPAGTSVYRVYRRAPTTHELIEAILRDCPFRIPFRDRWRDAGRAAEKVEARLRKSGALRVVERAEIARCVFYRDMGAYMVGRMFSGSQLIPLALALIPTPTGVAVDAVLLTENEVSILFSFTRSYFHVEINRPYDLVRFIKSIIPRKRVAELYIAIGYNKHGKTELYRDLQHHMTYCGDPFEISRGQRGMVMLVFNMPNDDLVFKVIKDRFAKPKTTTRREVMNKYDYVFKQDRAGRLPDAQVFEHLVFRRCCFSEELLDELLAKAARTVIVQGDSVVIRHAYVERRVIPLDIYIKEADPTSVRASIVDFGNVIKDLAATNIFTGDLLLKNFGVTRLGRVVFYDFDELCPLLSCNFRRLPEARSYDDELADEPWFSVEENDVFPEEFQNFLGLPTDLREVFMRHHSDLFDVSFWRTIQDRLKSGRMIRIYPYMPQQRLDRQGAARFPATPE